jgi:hypothetical protein
MPASCWILRETANREPNAEERSQFDTMMADARLQVRRSERSDVAEKSFAESQGRLSEESQPGMV